MTLTLPSKNLPIRQMRQATHIRFGYFLKCACLGALFFATNVARAQFPETLTLEQIQAIFSAPEQTIQLPGATSKSSTYEAFVYLNTDKVRAFALDEADRFLRSPPRFRERRPGTSRQIEYFGSQFMTLKSCHRNLTPILPAEGEGSVPANLTSDIPGRSKDRPIECYNLSKNPNGTLTLSTKLILNGKKHLEPATYIHPECTDCHHNLLLREGALYTAELTERHTREPSKITVTIFLTQSPELQVFPQELLERIDPFGLFSSRPSQPAPLPAEASSASSSRGSSFGEVFSAPTSPRPHHQRRSVLGIHRESAPSASSAPNTPRGRQRAATDYQPMPPALFSPLGQP